MLRQIECIISGRVQNVLYRDFARRKARGLGLLGFVENLPDGTVHVIAQGYESDLHQYILYLEKGSIFSKVEAVDVKWGNSLPTFSDFQIKYHKFSDHF